jgi:hypothetical protein
MIDNNYRCNKNSDVTLYYFLLLFYLMTIKNIEHHSIKKKKEPPTHTHTHTPNIE